MNNFENPKTAYVVSPSDTVDLVSPSVLYVGGTGNLKVTSALNSGTITFYNVQAGTLLPLVVKRVWSGVTTCSGIIGMY